MPGRGWPLPVVQVEAVLLSVWHDIASKPCPLPDMTSKSNRNMQAYQHYDPRAIPPLGSGTPLPQRSAGHTHGKQIDPKYDPERTRVYGKIVVPRMCLTPIATKPCPWRPCWWWRLLSRYASLLLLLLHVSACHAILRFSHPWLDVHARAAGDVKGDTGPRGRHAYGVRHEGAGTRPSRARSPERPDSPSRCRGAWQHEVTACQR